MAALKTATERRGAQSFLLLGNDRVIPPANTCVTYRAISSRLKEQIPLIDVHLIVALFTGTNFANQQHRMKNGTVSWNAPNEWEMLDEIFLGPH